MRINNKSFDLCENNIYIGKEEKLQCYCFKYNDIFYISWNNIRNNRSCSICSGKQTGERTSLSYLRPDLVEEFLYSENNKSPEKITLGSQECVYWQCSDCDWKWWATVVDRTHNESGCPACAGLVVSDKNRLSIRFPKLVKEWDKNKNNDLTPYDVSFGMSKKVWWICSNCGNSWKTEICNRTSGKGCSECADEQKESKIATELKEYILENYYAKKEYNIFKNPKTNHFLPFDIYIYDNIFIEIHGPQHYKFSTLFYKTQEEFEYRQYLDKIKKDYAQQNGLYIEVDLRKIKTTEEAIEYVEEILHNN